MQIVQYLVQIDMVYYIAGGAGAVVIAGLVLVVRALVRRKRAAEAFKKVISGDMRDLPESAAVLLSDRKAARLLEDTEQNTAQDVLRRTGFAQRWVQRIKARPRKALFMNVLRYNIQDGFFACFRYALEKKRYRKQLNQWLEQNRTQLPLLVIAHSAGGEDFDGEKACTLFREKLDEVRDLLGDPDWRGRYFALKVLLGDPGERSGSLLKGLFRDSHPLIRKIMVQEYDLSGDQEAKGILVDLIITDPHPGVRQAARTRFDSLYGQTTSIAAPDGVATAPGKASPAPDPKKLEPEQIIHLIEALRPGLEEDEAVATELVLSRNAEVRFHASRFLEDAEVLNRFCTRLDMADTEDYQRKTTILKNAALCGATGFLKKCLYTGTRECLLVASEILTERGDVSLAGNLLKLARDKKFTDVYGTAVRAIVLRGNMDEKLLLREELMDNLKGELLPVLAREITPLRDGIFIDPLLQGLEARAEHAETLRQSLKTKDREQLVSRLVQIVRKGGLGGLNGNGKGPSPAEQHVQVQSLILLAELEEEYCLSFILEHLPLLPVDLVVVLADAVTRFPEKVLKRAISHYLGQPDGQIRANLLALIPKTGLSGFLQQVRDAQKDADPLVRIASTFALVEMQDTKSYTRAVDLLRDPVEEVRAETARALGITGRKNVLERMGRVFFDPDEVAPVKRSIIRGAAASGDPAATDLLVEFMAKDPTYKLQIMDYLVEHTGAKNVQVLVDRMKDGGASLKKDLRDVFSRMGMACRDSLVGLLEASLSAYQEYAGELLDETGATEAEILKLKHRDPAVRREAARVLSLIGTVRAFRGLIMASRDPDRDVRVNVVKALEKLETPEGQAILTALEEDPDPRTRKYTHWALERLRAKELV